MKNKIQPAQYEPYDLVSASNNFFVESGLDYFNIELSESLSGNFNIDGSLKIDGFNVISPDISNSLSQGAYSNGSRILFGTSNVVDGSQNIIINGNDNNLNGTNNSILFGRNSDLTAQDSVAIGNNISINHNGAAVFADSTNDSKNSQAQNSLTIQYTGGVFLRSKTYFSENVFSDSDFTITGVISGLSLIVKDDARFLSNINVSGGAIFNQSANFYQNINVFGTATLQDAIINGSRVLNVSELDSYKTFASNTFATKSQFSSLSNETSSAFANVFNQLAGKLDISTFYESSNSPLKNLYVTQSGNQDIRGVKSFKNPAKFCDGLIFESINNCDRYIPQFSNSSGEAGYMVYSGNYLYVATGTNMWGRILISPWNSIGATSTTQTPTTSTPTTTTTSNPGVTTTTTTTTTTSPTTTTTTTTTTTGEPGTTSDVGETTTTSEEPTTTTTTTTTTGEPTTTGAARNAFIGELCNLGGQITIWLESASFDTIYTAYTASSGSQTYSGYFIYNGTTYFYTAGLPIVQACN